MPLKDLFNKLVNKTEEAADDAVNTVENAANELNDQAQNAFHCHRPPEPPKDANGNPMRPPDGMRPPMGGMGGRPEFPKDVNGNPIMPDGFNPPEGFKPPEGWTKPGDGETTNEV